MALRRAAGAAGHTPLLCMTVVVGVLLGSSPAASAASVAIGRADVGGREACLTSLLTLEPCTSDYSESDYGQLCCSAVRKFNSHGCMCGWGPDVSNAGRAAATLRSLRDVYEVCTGTRVSCPGAPKDDFLAAVGGGSDHAGSSLTQSVPSKADLDQPQRAQQQQLGALRGTVHQQQDEQAGVGGTEAQLAEMLPAEAGATTMKAATEQDHHQQQQQEMGAVASAAIAAWTQHLVSATAGVQEQKAEEEEQRVVRMPQLGGASGSMDSTYDFELQYEEVQRGGGGAAHGGSSSTAAVAGLLGPLSTWLVSTLRNAAAADGGGGGGAAHGGSGGGSAGAGAGVEMGVEAELRAVVVGANPSDHTDDLASLMGNLMAVVNEVTHRLDADEFSLSLEVTIEQEDEQQPTSASSAVAGGAAAALRMWAVYTINCLPACLPSLVHDLLWLAASGTAVLCLVILARQAVAACCCCCWAELAPAAGQAGARTMYGAPIVLGTLSFVPSAVKNGHKEELDPEVADLAKPLLANEHRC